MEGNTDTRIRVHRSGIATVRSSRAAVDGPGDLCGIMRMTALRCSSLRRFAPLFRMGTCIFGWIQNAQKRSRQVKKMPDLRNRRFLLSGRAEILQTLPTGNLRLPLSGSHNEEFPCALPPRGPGGIFFKGGGELPRRQFSSGKRPAFNPLQSQRFPGSCRTITRSDVRSGRPRADPGLRGGRVAANRPPQKVASHPALQRVEQKGRYVSHQPRGLGHQAWRRLRQTVGE